MQPVESAGKQEPVQSAGKGVPDAERGKRTAQWCKARRENSLLPSQVWSRYINLL